MSEENVALITAGGSGMGAAAACRLAQDGYKVAILSSSGKGEALARELGGVGITGSNHVAEDVQRLVDLAMDRWGRIDALVNSAGHGPRAPILEITDEDWLGSLGLNLLAAVRACRAVLPLMRAQGGGHVINITSLAGLKGFPGSGYYAASKHAVEGFSDALAAVRRELWATQAFSTSAPDRDMVEVPAALLDRLTQAACYPA